MEKVIYRPTGGMNNATHHKPDDVFDEITNLEPDGDIWKPMPDLAEYGNNTNTLIGSEFDTITKVAVWKPLYRYKDMVSDTSSPLNNKILLVYGIKESVYRLKIFVLELDGVNKNLAKIENEFLTSLEFTEDSNPVFFVSPRRVLITDSVQEPFFISVDEYGELFATWIRLDSPVLKPRAVNGTFGESLEFVRMETTGLASVPTNIGIGIESGQLLQYAYTIKTDRYEESAPSPIYTYTGGQTQYKQSLEDGVEPFVYWLTNHQLANVVPSDEEARYIAIYRREIKYTEDTLISGDFRLCTEVPVAGEGAVSVTINEPAIGDALRRDNYPIKGAKHICETGGSIFVSSNASELFVLGEFEKYLRIRIRNQNTRCYVNANIKIRLTEEEISEFQDIIDALMPINVEPQGYHFSPYVRLFDADRTTPLPLLFHKEDGQRIDLSGVNVAANAPDQEITIVSSELTDLKDIDYEFPCVEIKSETAPGFDGIYKIKRIIHGESDTTLILYYDGSGGNDNFVADVAINTEDERAGLWLISSIPLLYPTSSHDIFLMYNEDLQANPLPEEWDFNLEDYYVGENPVNHDELYEKLRYGAPINLEYIRNYGDIYTKYESDTDEASRVLRLPKFLVPEVFGLSPLRVRDNSSVIACSDEERTVDGEEVFVTNNANNTELGRGTFLGDAGFLYEDAGYEDFWATEGNVAKNTVNKIYQTGSKHTMHEGRSMPYNSNVIKWGNTPVCYYNDNDPVPGRVKFYDTEALPLHNSGRGTISFFAIALDKGWDTEDLTESNIIMVRGGTSPYRNRFQIALRKEGAWMDGEEEIDGYASIKFYHYYHNDPTDMNISYADEFPNGHFLAKDVERGDHGGYAHFHLTFSWNGQNAIVYLNGRLYCTIELQDRTWIRDGYSYYMELENDLNEYLAFPMLGYTQFQVLGATTVDSQWQARAIMNNTSLYDTQHIGYVYDDTYEWQNENIIIDNARYVRPESLYNTVSFIAYSDVGERGFASKSLISVNDDIKGLIPSPSFLKERYENTIVVLARNSVHRLAKGEHGIFEGMIEGINLGCVDDEAYTQYGNSLFWVSDNGIVRFSPQGLDVITQDRIQLPSLLTTKLYACISKNQIIAFSNADANTKKEWYVYIINKDIWCRYEQSEAMESIAQNYEDVVVLANKNLSHYPGSILMDKGELIKNVIQHYFSLVNLEYLSLDNDTSINVQVKMTNPLHDTTQTKTYNNVAPLDTINVPKGYYGTEALITMLTNNNKTKFDNITATLNKRIKRR